MITIGIADSMIAQTEVADHLKNIYSEAGARVEVILHPFNRLYYKNRQIGFRKYYKVLKDKYTDILIVKLTREGILNNVYKKIPLDVVIVTSDALTDTKGNNSKLYGHKIINSIGNYSYTIIPAAFENKANLGKNKRQLITYGMGRNAMVSASSIDIDVEGYHLLQCCIKSAIETFQGKVIDEQEFAIKVAQKDVDITLAGIATLLIYGIDCEHIFHQLGD